MGFYNLALFLCPRDKSDFTVSNIISLGVIGASWSSVTLTRASNLKQEKAVHFVDGFTWKGDIRNYEFRQNLAPHVGIVGWKIICTCNLNLHCRYIKCAQYCIYLQKKIRLYTFLYKFTWATIFRAFLILYFEGQTSFY